MTHTDYIDGDLKCTNNTKEASVNTYGGISRLEVDLTPAPTGGALEVVADNSNIAISEVRAYQRHNNSEEAATLDGNHAVDITTTLTQDLGVDDPFTCNFSSGICDAPAQAFDLTETEADKTLQFSLYSSVVLDAVTDLDVVANDPVEYQVALKAPDTTTVTAGDGFDIAIEAFDTHGNKATNWTENPVNITFLWTNTSNTDSSNGSGDNLAAVPDTTPIAFNFSGGDAESSGDAFKLYNEWDTNPTLTITNSG